MALLLIQPGSLPLLVPDDVEAGAAAHPQGGGTAEQGGGLHLGGQDTQALPRLPLVEQLLAHWHPLGVVLSIEGILALHHAGVPGLAQVFGSLHQGTLHLIVGHGGELDGGVLPAGPLVADRAGGDHHIVALNGQGDAAAGAHPDEGVRADVVQLLHGDHRRGAADAGGADAHLLPQKGSGIGGVLSVALYLHRVIKVGCDLLAAAGITGQETVAAHVAGLTFDMKLQLVFVHDNPPCSDKKLFFIIPPFFHHCKIYKSILAFVTFCCCFFCVLLLK